MKLGFAAEEGEMGRVTSKIWLLLLKPFLSMMLRANSALIGNLLPFILEMPTPMCPTLPTVSFLRVQPFGKILMNHPMDSSGGFTLVATDIGSCEEAIGI